MARFWSCCVAAVRASLEEWRRGGVPHAPEKPVDYERLRELLANGGLTKGWLEENEDKQVVGVTVEQILRTMADAGLLVWNDGGGMRRGHWTWSLKADHVDRGGGDATSYLLKATGGGGNKEKESCLLEQMW